MQPVSREQLNRNRYLRATSFEGKSELGDSFRTAVGDSFPSRSSSNSSSSRRREKEDSNNNHNSDNIDTMADPAGHDIDSTGETFSSSPRTAIADTPQTEPDADGCSSSSSPPTHPAFFSPPKAAVATMLLSSSSSSATGGTAGWGGRGGGGRKREKRSQGKENVCLNPMAASFSPLSCPRAVLSLPQKSPAAQQTGGSVMLGSFVGDGCADGARGDDCRGREMEKEVLGNVDTNFVAVPPSEKINGEDQVSIASIPKSLPTSKKNNMRKSKKANGLNGGEINGHAGEKAPAEPISYAEAVKEDPADVEKREDIEAERGQQEETAPSAPQGSEEENGAAPGTAAGDKTFADALKEEPPEHTSGGSKEKSKSQENSSGRHTSDRSPSQASTSVEYPDIGPDADDGEAAQRQKDKEAAPEVFGTRWAPLKVPIKRRFQTAAVLMHCLCIGLSLSIFFGLCANPFLWPIIIIYLVSMLFATDATDGRLRKRREWVRRLPLWTYFAEYFPAKLHKTHDLQPTRKYILGYHPHGIISHGAWAAFATDALGFSDKFPGITNSLCTLDSNFNLPLYREYVFAMGLSSVSKESIKNLLTHGGPNNEGMGRAVTIVVGGARESLEAQPNTMRLIINERKGFIKIALQTGADLVPVLAFGENDLYDQLDPHKHPWLHGLQRYFLKAWKFTVPLLHGRGIFNYDVGLMPYRRPMNIVVGKPIPVMQQANPDNSEVNRLHDLYTEELQTIWERYKDEFASHRKEEMQFVG